MLDMHPLIGIAHQVNALNYEDKDMLFNALLGRMYSTETLDGIDVIGTKSGHQTMKHLLRNPDYSLDKFKALIDMPLKIIHIVRNPFDNLSTWVNRAKEEHQRKGIDKPEIDILNAKIAHYYEVNQKIQEVIDTEDVFTYRLDRLIKKPGKTVKAIYEFLEVPFNGEIVTQAKSMIYEKQRITRESISWNDDTVKDVMKIIEEFDFLKGYKFELSEKLKNELKDQEMNQRLAQNLARR